ncbi:MAG: hypothetical protein AAF797_17805 [Planctomycetota bacterium]
MALQSLRDLIKMQDGFGAEAVPTPPSRMDARFEMYRIVDCTGEAWARSICDESYLRTRLAELRRAFRLGVGSCPASLSATRPEAGPGAEAVTQ